ncbi:MAG: hypothetical protein ACO1SX_14310 [Actinomycetota bacterium]
MLTHLGGDELYLLTQANTLGAKSRGLRGSRIYHALVYGISSLGRKAAGAQRLLSLTRKHCEIEHRSHWIRDTLFREDDSRSGYETLVQVLTSLRCAALTLRHTLRRQEQRRSVASSQRRLKQPTAILALTGTLG